MKVEFIDTEWISDNEKIVMELDIIPRLGETLHFCTSLLEDNYIDMFDGGDEVGPEDFIVVNKHTGNKYKTVEAVVNKVTHIYKPSGNIVEIYITFIECDEFDKDDSDNDNL